MILAEARGRPRRSRRPRAIDGPGLDRGRIGLGPGSFPGERSGNDDDPAKWATATMALTLGLASIWGLASWRLHPRPQVLLEAPPEVEVVKPVAREIRDTDIYVGTTEPSRSLEIRANVNGRLGKVGFSGGRWVKEGDLLFEIDGRRACAAAEIAEVQIELKRMLMQAKQHPAGSPAAGGPLDAATLNKARADLGVAEAVRDQAKMALDSTRIKAPFDGVISRNRINPGDPVVANKTSWPRSTPTTPSGVFKVAEPTLLNLTRLEMDEGLKINDLPILVKMTGDDDFRREARIKSVSQAIDRATGTGTIRATMPNPDRFLLPGMSARSRWGRASPTGSSSSPDPPCSPRKAGRPSRSWTTTTASRSDP